MRKKRFLKMALATVMTLTMTCSLFGTVTAKAAEINFASEEDTSIGMEGSDIKYQEAVQISELESAGSSTPCKMTGNVDVDESESETFPMVMSDSTVMAGTVSD